MELGAGKTRFLSRDPEAFFHNLWRIPAQQYPRCLRNKEPLPGEMLVRPHLILRRTDQASFTSETALSTMHQSAWMVDIACSIAARLLRRI